MINADTIRTLKPCIDRLDNYSKHYGAREFTNRQFMGLKNITHEDKIWVAFRMIPKENVGKIAGEIAKTVLHIYEAKYPNDNRPRISIEAAVTNTVTYRIRTDADAAYATYAAAYAADAAYAAAYAASTAAYAATYAAAYVAAYAATYAAAYVAAYATYAAAYAADAAYASSGKSAKGIQEKLIRKICLKYWKET